MVAYWIDRTPGTTERSGEIGSHGQNRIGYGWQQGSGLDAIA
jgi:hypothetical protein